MDPVPDKSENALFKSYICDVYFEFLKKRWTNTASGRIEGVGRPFERCVYSRKIMNYVPFLS